MNEEQQLLSEIRDGIGDVASGVSSLEIYLMEIDKKLSRVIDGLDALARAVKNQV